MNRQAQDLASRPFRHPPLRLDEAVGEYLQDLHTGLENLRHAVLLNADDAATAQETPTPGLPPDDALPTLVQNRPTQAEHCPYCDFNAFDAHGRFCGYYYYTGTGSGDSSEFIWNSPYGVRGICGEAVGQTRTTAQLRACGAEEW